MTDPVFFATPGEWRDWLEANHATAREVSVGFWKKETRRPSITWAASVDEALCFGWIDGVRHSVDESAYRIRFTPRKPGSVWSRKNLARYRELEAEGRVRPAGRAAFESGKTDTTRYSFENAPPELTPEETARLEADPAAAADFAARAPGYRRTALWWVVSAKRPKTRAGRLGRLIEAHAQGRKIEPLRRTPDE